MKYKDGNSVDVGLLLVPFRPTFSWKTLQIIIIVTIIKL